MTYLILTIFILNICPTELQLNKANFADTEALVLESDFSISNDIDSSKIYDKRDYFNFEIVNSPFLTVNIFCSLFVLPECVLMLNSTIETYF